MLEDLINLCIHLLHFDHYLLFIRSINLLLIFHDIQKDPLNLLAVGVCQIIISLNDPLKALFYCALEVINGISFRNLACFFISHRLFREFKCLKFRDFRFDKTCLNKSYSIFVRWSGFLWFLIWEGTETIESNEIIVISSQRKLCEEIFDCSIDIITILLQGNYNLLLTVSQHHIHDLLNIGWVRRCLPPDITESSSVTISTRSISGFLHPLIIATISDLQGDT